MLRFSAQDVLRRHPLAQKGDTSEIIRARIIKKDGMVEDAAAALKSRKINDPLAQAILAHKILVDGTAEIAEDLLMEGVVTGNDAQRHLLRKIGEERYGRDLNEFIATIKFIDQMIRMELEETMRGQGNSTAHIGKLIERRRALRGILDEIEELIGPETMRKFWVI